MCEPAGRSRPERDMPHADESGAGSLPARSASPASPGARPSGSVRGALCLGLWSLVGCAQQVHLRVGGPPAQVRFAEQELGEVGGEGVDVRVDAGTGPVPFEIRRGLSRTRGVVERSEVDVTLLAAGMIAAGCGAPTLAGVALLAANPLLAASLLTACAVQSPALAIAATNNLGWVTLPAAALGGALGALPCASAVFALRLPTTIELTSAPAAAPAHEGEGARAAGPGQAARRQRGMAW